MAHHDPADHLPALRRALGRPIVARHGFEQLLDGWIQLGERGTVQPGVVLLAAGGSIEEIVRALATHEPAVDVIGHAGDATVGLLADIGPSGLDRVATLAGWLLQAEGRSGAVLALMATGTSGAAETLTEARERLAVLLERVGPRRDSVAVGATDGSITLL